MQNLYEKNNAARYKPLTTMKRKLIVKGLKHKVFQFWWNI